MTLIFLLLILFVPALAQGDSTISLNSNRTAVLRLAGDGAYATAAYDSDGGDVVSVTADSGGALDTVMELVGPDGRTIAYADAPDTDPSMLVRIALDEAGTYTIRVNTFNGEGSGDVMVTLTVQVPFALTPDAPTVWVPLGVGDVGVVTLDGFDSADAMTITVRDPRGLLDPRVAVRDGDGTLMAENDDHGTADVTLNRFDARLTAAPTGGATLAITDFLGRAGWLEVSIRP